MTSLRVDSEKCDGCALCMRVCPFGAIEMEGGKPRFTDDCRLCPICEQECPQGAIWLPEESKSAEDATGGDVLVVAQLRGNATEFAPVTFELIGEGLRLAAQAESGLHVAVLGHKLSSLPQQLLPYGVSSVQVYDHPRLCPFQPLPHTDVLQDAIERLRPAAVLMAASEKGRSLAPRLAVRLRTGLTADCTSLQMTRSGVLKQTRPAFGGDIMATIATETRPQMATVRPGVMEPAGAGGQGRRQGEVQSRELPPEVRRMSRVSQVQSAPGGRTIADADIVVAAGRGIRKQEDLQLLEELADALGGMVGCSRPLVENGWLPNTRQVGLSGRTVRARLYIACGISGAIQHVAGMRQSDVIFAINRDEDAPIFEVADYAVVGDLYEVIPALLSAVQEGGRVDEI